MKLDKNKNYIVSGLERSGTSLMMQILQSGGYPTSFDSASRPPDDNNPRGYFELEGGKIINRLMEGSFPFEDYKGRFIKITAFGMKFLPSGDYKVIYSLRDIDEILDSMEKMAKIKDDDRSETKQTFIRLNEMIKTVLEKRDDVEVLFASYNDILNDPSNNIKKIYDFMSVPEAQLKSMIDSVDRKLYRNRKV